MATLNVLILIVTLLALTVSSARASHHQDPRMDRLAHYRASLNTHRERKCLPRMEYRWKVWQVPMGLLPFVVLQTKTWIFDAIDAPSRCVPWYVTKQIWAAGILARDSELDPWPNCEDPGPRDNQGPGHTWTDTVNCENSGNWLDSPGFYRCGLQFHPNWESRFGRLCP